MFFRKHYGKNILFKLNEKIIQIKSENNRIQIHFLRGYVIIKFVYVCMTSTKHLKWQTTNKITHLKEIFLKSIICFKNIP